MLVRVCGKKSVKANATRFANVRFMAKSLSLLHLVLLQSRNHSTSYLGRSRANLANPQTANRMHSLTIAQFTHNK